MNNQPARSRPDWVSKLFLPIAAAVVGAILVTALTPLGQNLQEFLFPTKVDVTGSVTVDGRRAAGARLVLDGAPVPAADDEGTFVLPDVDDGSHTLEIKAVSSKAKRHSFTVERDASEQSLGEIQLVPLAELGYDPSIGSTFEGLTFDVTLWIIAEREVLDRIQSVAYTLPSPFPASVATVRNAPGQSFCLRRRGTFQSAGGVRSPAAVVDLGEGRTFSISARGAGQPGAPDCEPTGGSSGPGPSPGPAPGPQPQPQPQPQPGPSPPPQPPAVVVPSVEGVLFVNARALLESRGFRVTRRDVVSDETVETVVGQDPRAGASRRRGSTVSLSVSVGPAVDVPDVTDQTEADAVSKLEGSGFEVAVQRRATDDTGQVGVVLEQSPAGGEKAARGSTVTIFVGELEA